MLSASKTAAPSTGGYSIQKSVRLRSSASAYLNRTPASTTNRQTFTWSAWVKKGLLSTNSQMGLFDAYSSGTAEFAIGWMNDDTLRMYDLQTTNQLELRTTAVYRDPSAWYHIVLAVDTTQATSSNRAKLYVNGSQITTFGTATYPSQNYNTNVNVSTIPNWIGRSGYGYIDAYQTEVNFIDGQALTPTSFGAFNATTGVWQPIKYTGTYGTNGFYLNFSNNASTTTLGYDTSGNGNNWTTNNISLTTGSTYDSMTDVPTLTSATAANYAVLNPIGGAGASLGINSGNLQWNYTTNSNVNGYATMYMPSGQWYVECEQTSGANTDIVLGFATQAFGQPSATSLVSDAGYFGYTYAGRSWNFGSQTNGNPTLTVGTDVMNFAIDITNGKAWIGKNGTWFGSGNPATGANPWWTFTAGTAYTFAMAVYNAVGWINFGQRPFANSAPTGFVALNTYNLPAPTIKNGAAYMAATTYTGTGANLTVSNATNNTIGTTFTPDLVWIKSRSNALDHKLTDSVRGTTKALISDSTGAETTDSGGVTAFNSNGFTVGTTAQYNANSSVTYVGWQWLAGAGTSSSNTNGSITSTVSVNATAGFSVVTYTGNGTTGATIGHGLNAVPYMMITKRRSTTSDWGVYHQVLGNTNYLLLDTTAASTAGSNVWNNTSPTSTVFTVGNASFTNTSTDTFVAYCFTQIAGYSKFGSYTGNSSADGTFVYLGFRPRYLLLKNTTTAGYDWFVLDSSRNTYNVTNNYLYPDLSNAEGSSYTVCDFLSNGIKFRDSTTNWNGSSNTYIYACFAENPFNYSLAR